MSSSAAAASAWPWTLRSLNPTPPTNAPDAEFDIGSVLHAWDLSPAAIETETQKTIESTRAAYDLIGSLANSPDAALTYDAVIKVPIQMHYILMPSLFSLSFFIVSSQILLQQLGELERFASGRKGIIGLYMHVSDSKAVRDAAMEARKKLNSFETEMLYVYIRISRHYLLIFFAQLFSIRYNF